MKLLDIVRRDPNPAPWSEGEKIPWHEPAFSERMLREHLTQAHDAASRRASTIDAHVRFIHEGELRGRPGRILDLGCGPGLYCSRLARLGHTCVGIDVSPASIAHAREEALRDGLSCSYRHEDLRSADYLSLSPDRASAVPPKERPFDLAMLLFGELNTFRRSDAENFLGRVRRALVPGGTLLLEPHTFDCVQKLGGQPPVWYATASGLFSDRPHLCLKEAFWRADDEITTERWHIVDAGTGDVTRHAASMQAYSEADYRALLEGCGYVELSFHPTLTGDASHGDGDLFALTARNPL
jgi:SAM-dependent methyltransferase